MYRKKLYFLQRLPCIKNLTQQGSEIFLQVVFLLLQLQAIKLHAIKQYSESMSLHPGEWALVSQGIRFHFAVCVRKWCYFYLHFDVKPQQHTCMFLVIMTNYVYLS